MPQKASWARAVKRVASIVNKTMVPMTTIVVTVMAASRAKRLKEYIALGFCGHRLRGR